MIVKIKIVVSLLCMFLLQACLKDELSDISNTQTVFPKYLSEYNIYEGAQRNLEPSADYVEYILGTTLFTDYADKQRLIKLPAGTKMEIVDGEFPVFPDGTIMAKTFFYYHDKRDTLKGKRIIETRLLIKENDKWNVANYLWNEEQTDARLIEDGLNTTVNYIDAAGDPKVVGYHVPNNRECATCHSISDKLIPIGPKVRNLNLDIETPIGSQNQLTYLQGLGMVGDFDHSEILDAPSFIDTALSIEKRARAYLDVNCAHCHRDGGFAEEKVKLSLDYKTSLEASNIREKKDDILRQMNGGGMPFLGASVLDEEGIALITEYIKSLQ